MKVVIAPDSFKESVGAATAAATIARGVRAVFPQAQCCEVPMSDGGEGFTDAIADGLNAQIMQVPVHDPLGRPVTGRIAVAPGIAALEVAAANGLDLVHPEDRDLLGSHTRGVGELLLAAAKAIGPGGRVVVGLGGTATSDGGAGMLAACGARLLDHEGREVEPTPQGLEYLASVDLSGLSPLLAEVQIEAACDVTAPLLGPEGAAAVFGPQKGARPEDVPRIDAALERLAKCCTGQTGLGGATVPARQDDAGAGAAGGLGWALTAVLGAEARPGVELVAQTIGLADTIADADLVITGEGSVDAQTLTGKTIGGIAALASQAQVPCVVLAGRVAPDADVLLEHGVSALLSIVPGPVSLTEALASGEENLERTAATAMRLLQLGAERGPQASG